MIPTQDEANQIQAAVESAAGADLIVVVDGGSADDTISLAVAAGAHVIKSPPGRARQLAAGVKEVERLEQAQQAQKNEEDPLLPFDAYLFLHADTRLPVDFTTTVETVLSDPGVVGGAFGFRFDWSQVKGTRFERISLRVVEWGTRMRNQLFGLPYGDQALFIRPRVLAKFGGIPQLNRMEDLELVLRLKRRGHLEIASEDITTSARRYLQAGVWRTVASHACLLKDYALGADHQALEGE